MTAEPGAAPAYALELTDAERARYRVMAERAREREGEAWTRFGVVEGARIVDLGCGPGAVLVHLAEIAGPAGAAIGVEPNASARAVAEEELAGKGLKHARVVAGDGAATGIEPGSQDVVMLRHVLFHVGPRVQEVVDHAASLLRPGGHLYIVDVDATALRVTTMDADFLDQAARYQAFQRERGNNIDMGVWLGWFVRRAGLELVERSGWLETIPGALFAMGGPAVAARREMLAAGVATEDDAVRWDAARRRVAADPDAMMFTTLHRAVGRRPPV
jgi:SAM-dependent methyltransferase